MHTFGTGIAEHFMIPYNRKVWSYDLGKMDFDWIADRISVVDFERVLHNVLMEEDEREWGPNYQFSYAIIKITFN